MISVTPSTTAPIGGRGDFDGPNAPRGNEAPAQAGAPAADGDALAKFGAENGLHADVRQLAHPSSHAVDDTARADAQKAQAQQLMDEGNKLLQAKKYDAAIARFQEGFALYPSEKFMLNIAAALRDSGRFAEAALAYERYLIDPQAPRADEARQMLADVRARLGGREITAADIAEAKRLVGEGAKAFTEGRIEDAFKAWQAAYELNPIPTQLFDQAVCMQRLGANYSAARLFHAYAAADPKPKDADAVKARGDMLLERARKEPITATGMAGGMEWMARGNEALRAHRYDEAIAAYDEGFRTYPSEKFILNKASALLDSGRYAEADLAYGRYLSDPNAERAAEARAAQLRAREHMGGREATITGVVESQRLIGEGGALLKAGKFADALQAFERAYSLNPLAQLRHSQAQCLERMGRYELAASRYEQYLQEAPQAPDADKVRKHAAGLHAAARDSSFDAFTRGQKAYQAGDFKGAAAAFAEAYSHLPLPDLLFNQGQALDKAGDVWGAVKAYQLYLNMAPDTPDAGKVRARIEALHQANGSALEKPVDSVAEAKLKLAQQAFDNGQKAYQQGRWTDAAHHFAEAYAQRPFPQFLYNVGASLHKAGDTMGAVKAYQQYLNAFPDAPDADKVRKTIQFLLERAGAALMKPGD